MSTEVTEFRKTHNIAILQNIRKEIIDALKRYNFKHTVTYNISVAHPDSLRFVITLLTKGDPETPLLQIRKNLVNELDHKVTTNEIEGSPEKLAVDVEQLYEERLEAKGGNGEITDTLKNKSLKRAGRNKSDFGMYRDTLVSFIEKETTAKKDVKTTGFYITVEQGTPKKILLHCANKHITETIVQKLETNEVYEPRVLKVVKDVVYVCEDIVAENTERKVALNFFERLRMEALKQGYPISITTSATIAISVDPVSLSMRCANSGDAAALASELNPNWKPTKDGMMVNLELTKLVWKHALVEDGFFIKKQQDGGLVVKPLGNGAALVGSYVHSSMKYRDFEFLPFNRKRKKRHTNEIKKSMERWGVLSFVTVAITDCIDGDMRMWVIDGQHRFDAMELLQNPILFTIANVHSKKEMVRLIAALNRTSKNWALRDYLHSWCSIEIPEYVLIQETLGRTKLPITLILEAFSGLDRRAVTEKFQAGEFEIADKEKAKRYIGHIVELKTLMPRSRAILSCLLSLFNQYEEKYNNDKMKEMIKATKVKLGGKLPFTAGDTAEITLKTLRKIYEGQYL